MLPMQSDERKIKSESLLTTAHTRHDLESGFQNWVVWKVRKGERVWQRNIVEKY